MQLNRIKRRTDALAAVDVAEESFVAIEFDRALLARVAPSFAHSGAAELLGAHDTLQLALAHVVVDARETRARPVIFYGDQQKTKPKSINTVLILRSCFISGTYNVD